MNKRLLLALLLMGVVVVVTPYLFPAPKRAPAAVVSADSIRPAAPHDSAAPALAPSGAAAQNRAAADTTAAATVSTIATAKARLRLSSAGGALVGAEMKEYRTLGADSQPVELAPRGEPLLRFRIVAGTDTLRVDRMATAPTQSESQIAFAGVAHGVPVTVRWSFAPDTHHVHVRGGDEPVGYLTHVDVSAPSLRGSAYLLVDLPTGFRSSESDSVDDFRHLAYAYKPASGGSDLVRFGKPAVGQRTVERGPLVWAVAKSKYFLVGVLAPTDADRFAELQVAGVPKTGRLATRGEATVVVPMRGGAAALEVYAGPQEWKRLVAVGREFENSNPYGGWMQGIVQPFATIVMRALLGMRAVLKLNYGWTLIIFGFLIRIVLWPLNQKAMRSNLKLQRIQPELAEVQKKYASNPEKQREEIMRVYREHGMSPFSPLSGCLPMLIPMPVLFALFFVFQNTIEFRGVGFWWMTDISQKDPYYILPLIMGASMFLLSWLGLRNAPPNPQAKMMAFVFPGIMVAFLLNFAAGLNLYYAAQNLASIPQQWLIANERAKANPRSG